MILGAVKINAEGFEEYIIKGGLNFIKRLAPKVIQIECSKRMKELGSTSQSLFKTIQEIGYDVHRYSFAGPLLTKP